MNCQCLSKIDAKLKAQNLELTGCIYVMPEFKRTPVIACGWIDRDKAPKGKRNSPPPMIASHCPFCGRKIKAKRTKKIPTYSEWVERQTVKAIAIQDEETE